MIIYCRSCVIARVICITSPPNTLFLFENGQYIVKPARYEYQSAFKESGSTSSSVKYDLPSFNLQHMCIWADNSRRI